MSLEQILLAIAAAVVPALGIFLLTQLLKLNAFFDGLPALVKQLVTVAEAYALALAAGFLGIVLPADLGGLDPVTVQTALSALFSWVIHRYFGKKPAPTVA